MNNNERYYFIKDLFEPDCIKIDSEDSDLLKLTYKDCKFLIRLSSLSVIPNKECREFDFAAALQNELRLRLADGYPRPLQNKLQWIRSKQGYPIGIKYDFLVGRYLVEELFVGKSIYK